MEPTIAWERKQLIINPGESLFVCNRGIVETSNQYGMPLGEIPLSRTLRDELTAPPERMIERVRDLLETQVAASHPARSQHADRQAPAGVTELRDLQVA